MSYLKRLTKNDTNTHTSYRNFKNLFKPIKLKEQKYKKSRIELKKRFTGINDQAYSYMKKNPYKKTRLESGFRLSLAERQLLNFSFFIRHMLTNHRIKLFDLHFFRHGTFVFICCIKMASTGRRIKSNFFSHNLRSLGIFSVIVF